MTKPLRFGLVAGESSGDILGAGLIAALKERFPDAEFEGIGGPLMLAEGFNTRVPMERLAVMGIVEVMGRLPELLRVRRNLRQHFLENPPDLFIGIDAPDFNLGLEKKLKRAGIKTVHYVGPQIWAWRQGRAKRLSGNLDKMLVLFPFETQFYSRYNIPVVFVGHPLADEIETHTPRFPARQKLNLAPDDQVIAILPGSRLSEAKRMTATFLRAAGLCRTKLPKGKIIVAASTDTVAGLVAETLESEGIGDVQIFTGHARDVMAAADVVLSASGTATLEVSLVKRPLVVAYKMTQFTYWIARKLVKTDYVALPNLLMGKALVPEILQGQASPENLAAELSSFLHNPERAAKLESEYAVLHEKLRQNASVKAADAVLCCLELEQ